MIRAFDLMRRLRAGVASVLLLSATGSYALNTATIVGSVASPDCLEYRVVGICYWLYWALLQIVGGDKLIIPFC